MQKTFIIHEDFVNSRIDRWFRKIISNLPQSLIEKNLRKGKIQVNNKRIKSSHKLKKNDLIFIDNLKFTENRKKLYVEKYKATKNELTQSSKMFIENNENFVVINKPAGIAIQAGTKSRRNIIDILRNTKEFSNSTPYPVHRIDKETTGVLIVAKNRKYAQLFTSLFRIRKIHKTYLGVVLGELKKKKGTFIDQLFHYEGKKEGPAVCQKDVGLKRRGQLIFIILFK